MYTIEQNKRLHILNAFEVLNSTLLIKLSAVVVLSTSRVCVDVVFWPLTWSPAQLTHVRNVLTEWTEKQTDVQSA